MARGLKPIIITLLVIVVIVIACVLLLVVFPEKPDPDAEATATATSTGSAEVYVIRENDDNLVSFEAIPADGPSMLVGIERNSQGELSYSVTPPTPHFTYDTSKFRSMMYTITSISATNFVEKDAGDLSVYGLDKPAFTLRSTYSDGKVIDLYLGSQTLVDDQYYVMTNQSGDVYTIGSYLVSLLTRGDLSYRNLTLFPAYTGDAVYENIRWIKLTLRDGTEVEIAYDADFASSGDAAASEYVMTLPTQSYCNDTSVKSLLNQLSTAVSSSVYRDVAEDEYAEYGLDRPAKLQMTDIAGNSLELLVGNETYYGSGSYFAMLADAPNTVIIVSGSYTDDETSVTTSAFAWIGMNYIEHMNRIVWLSDITGISSIDYDLGGETHKMGLEHSSYVNDDGNTIKVVTATLDGSGISESNARRLFVRSVNFRISGEIPADQRERSGKADYTIRFNLSAGESTVLEFCKLNDRQYACYVDGKGEFYTNVKNIRTLVNAFQTVLSGGDLEMSYDSY